MIAPSYWRCQQGARCIVRCPGCTGDVTTVDAITAKRIARKMGYQIVDTIKLPLDKAAADHVDNTDHAEADFIARRCERMMQPESAQEGAHKIKRFLVFAHDHYYPSGGWGDFKSAHDDLPAAKAAALQHVKYDRREIIDMETLEQVWAD